MVEFICSVCGSADVEVKVWTKPNKNFENTLGGLLDVKMIEQEDCWCNDCQEHQELKIV